MSGDVRVIAFYLPQFHPIPENDQWWGTGFTEWTNVTRGRADVHGALPAATSRRARLLRSARHGGPAPAGALARKYGIHGFCYYYYWFSGRRLLERPLDLMLADRELGFSVLLLLGERELVAALGRLGAATS